MKSNITNWSGDIGSKFSELGSNALTWGKDLVGNMASGIKNNVGKVTSAVSSVANKIKDFLHFSEPDVGPLSNFHTYMPDMIDLMASGIRNNVGKVTSELENLTSTMSYTINTPDISLVDLEANINTNNIKPQSNVYETTRRAFEDAMFSNNNNGQDIYLTFKVGDEELGQVVIDTLGNIKRNTGKGLEVLIGG